MTAAGKFLGTDPKAFVPLFLWSLLHKYYLVMVLIHISLHLSWSLLVLWLLADQLRDVDGAIQDEQLIYMLSFPLKPRYRRRQKSCGPSLSFKWSWDLNKLYSWTWQHGRSVWLWSLDKPRKPYMCEKTQINWSRQLSALRWTRPVLRNNGTGLGVLAWVPLAEISWQQIFQGLYRTSHALMADAQLSITYKKLLPTAGGITGRKASVHRLQLYFPL